MILKRQHSFQLECTYTNLQILIGCHIMEAPGRLIDLMEDYYLVIVMSHLRGQHWHTFYPFTPTPICAKI